MPNIKSIFYLTLIDTFKIITVLIMSPTSHKEIKTKNNKFPTNPEHYSQSSSHYVFNLSF